MYILADDSPSWAVVIPLIAAVVGAIGALLYNLFLKRRDEKRERRAVARLIDDDLAGLESALEAFKTKSESNADYRSRLASAAVVQQARSGAAWNDTKLLLARLVSFEDWDVLRDVYTVIRVSWLEVDWPPAKDGDDEEFKETFDEVRLAFNAESVAPGLLKVIARGRKVCLSHLGGTPPAKVSLGSPEAMGEGSPRASGEANGT